MRLQKSLEIYKSTEGEVVFDVDVQKETLWATQEQISQLFKVDRTVISRHLRNIFKSGELEEQSVCAKNARTAADGKVYQTKIYNLDAIISVGYRVNSRAATDFRIWATKILHQYVVDGVALNERRLKELDAKKLDEIEGAIGVVRRLMLETELSAGEASGILEVMAQYAGSFETLKEYQAGQIKFGTGRIGRKKLTELDFQRYIENLRRNREETRDFGFEKKGDFGLMIEELEREVGEEKIAVQAAELLWLVAQEKPFKKGNEEIAALLFIAFLTVNDYQLTRSGKTKISDRALTALVLLIGASQAEERELMVALVCRMLED